MSVIIERYEKIDNEYCWLGYKILTNDTSKNITCKISNTQYCCETYGVFCKNNLDDFIGAEYEKIEISEKTKEECGETETSIKILIHTSKGVIEIILYNQHNGYYSHEYYINSENGVISDYI